MSSALSLHWFRRDLRIAGNPALRSQLKQSKSVLGLFFFDSQFLARDDFSNNRFAFFLNSLKQLKSDLLEVGSDLLIVDKRPKDGFEILFGFFKSINVKVQRVTFCRDYEPFALQRDKEIIELFKQMDINYESFKDHLVFEPDEIFKDKPGDYYQVYTPFYNKWRKVADENNLHEQLKLEEKGFSFLDEKNKVNFFHSSWSPYTSLQAFPFQDSLENFINKNNPKVSISVPKAGTYEAFNYLKDFKEKISDYASTRNFPEVKGTSNLSIFFKNGSISTRQVLAYLNLLSSPAYDVFLKEIVWREFYYSILYYRPDVEHCAFKKEFNKIQWQNNETWFGLWKQGLTGFPIVDAGMRQLNQTGWMHNRVRMIVASFLVKDLLIDWRWGENYFMKMLLDGDMAPNNGGWQWAASTGCDAQPYFRVFNPWLQSEKFDPQAIYIKTYLPELKDLSSSVIHDPEGIRPNYPRPIVHHAEQKEKAIALFKK